jgi:hypothetical protein
LELSRRSGKVDAMRSNLIITLIGLGLVTSAATAPLAAHHAFAAEFDANKPVHFKGTLTRIEWTNPHTWIHLDVKMPDGSVENWAFEGGTPNNLLRRGFTRTILQPGTEVVVDGYQAKDGSHRANGRDITFADGRNLFLGSSGTGAPYELVPDNQKNNTGQAGPGVKK